MTQMKRQTSCGRSRYRSRSGPLLAFVAALIPILAVFGSSAMSVTAAESTDQILIGLITKTEVNPFFVKMRQAAAAEAEKHGAKLIARFGKFDGDNEGQVAAIENMISAGVKGILITPSNSTGVLGAVKKLATKASSSSPSIRPRILRMLLTQLLPPTISRPVFSRVSTQGRRSGIRPRSSRCSTARQVAP